MRKSLLSLAAACSLIVISLAPAVAQSVPNGSYQQTCTNIRVRGDVLSARCNGQSGNTRSTISLASCGRGDIANVNGQLTCNGRRNRGQGNFNGNGNGYGNRGGYAVAGSYQSSCSNVSNRGGMLTATCSAGNGNTLTSSIDPTRCSGRDIANINGRLRCR